MRLRSKFFWFISFYINIKYYINILCDLALGIFGKLGEIQSVLCLAFGVGGVLYTGTFSGDIYKWQGVTLLENISGAHAVSSNFTT